MIKADARTVSVELEETVLDQLLEFSITEDSEEQVVEKVGKRLCEKICKRQ